MASSDCDDFQYSDDDEQRGFLLTKRKVSGRQRQSRLRKLLCKLTSIVAYALATAVFVYLALAFFGLPRSKQPVIQRSPCGSTASEAKALGCTFDIISFAWLPPACYDAELSDTFDELREWQWFLDVNQTQPVSKAEALTGEFPVLYVNWEYHIVHCTYMWKKMHRAILGSGRSAIDGYIGPYAHTEHCSHMLLSRRELDLDVINTGIRVKYPDCGVD